MANTKRSYVVGDHFDAYIAGQLESGRFNNASEVVRNALRMMEEHDKKLTALQVLIDEGVSALEAGQYTEYESANDLAEDIIKRGMERSKRKG